MSHRTKMMSAARSLKQNLTVDPGIAGPYQWGTVAAVHATSPFATADVYLDSNSGSTGATLALKIPYINGYNPTVGDVVLIARMGGSARTQRVILGCLETANHGITQAGAFFAGGPISGPAVSGGSDAPSSYGSVPLKYDEQIITATNADITIPPSGSLPTTFRHIEIVYRLQNVTDTAGNIELSIVMSGDGGTHYGSERLQGGVNSAIANEVIAANSYAGQFYVGDNGNGVPSTGRIFIPDYNFVGGHAWRISWNVQNGLVNPPATPMFVGETAQFWYNNAAITKVTIRQPSTVKNLTGVVTTYLWP